MRLSTVFLLIRLPFVLAAAAWTWLLLVVLFAGFQFWFLLTPMVFFLFVVPGSFIMAALSNDPQRIVSVKAGIDSWWLLTKEGFTMLPPQYDWLWKWLKTGDLPYASKTGNKRH
ncbi:MAG: hypothetical protein V4550_02190 [Gemmatimonadota bacterium]